VKSANAIALTSEGWSRDPASVALGTDRTGVSTAFWTHDVENVQEVGSRPLDVHLLSVQFSGYHAELWLDGRRAFSKWLRPGDSSLVRPGESPRAVQTGAFRVLHLYVPPAFLLDILNQSEHASGPSPELIQTDLGHDPAIARIGREVLSEMRAGLPLSRLWLDGLGQQLGVHLLRRWSDRSRNAGLAEARSSVGLAPWQQRRAIECLSERLGENLPLAELAAATGLSPFHFARMFKRATGLAPYAFQRQLRCEKAKELLVSTELGIGEIAAAVGYETPQAFARMFRAQVGSTPSAFRRAERV
jgi:AraC family transcriptional regulator